MTKPTNREQVAEQAARRIEALLEQADFIKRVEIRKEMRKGVGPDFTAEIFTGDQRLVLLVEARPSGEPRHAREAVNALLVAARMWSHACPVFAAPYISEKAAQICRENGAGHLDLAGNCHICLDGILIRIKGNPNPFREKRGLKSLASPGAARIIHVLLNHPGRSWKTAELAETAGVSTGLVSGVARRLRDREWIEPGKKGIRMARPRELLEHWIAGYRGAGESLHRFYAPMDRVRIENTLARRCAEKEVQCAFSGLSAAVHLASGTDYRVVQACAASDAGLPGKTDGFEPGREKANVWIATGADKGVFYGARRVAPASRMQYCDPSDKTVAEIEDEIQVPIRIVSPVQAYRDLRTTFKTDGGDAEKIFGQVIAPSF